MIFGGFPHEFGAWMGHKDRQCSGFPSQAWGSWLQVPAHSLLCALLSVHNVKTPWHRREGGSRESGTSLRLSFQSLLRHRHPV